MKKLHCNGIDDDTEGFIAMLNNEMVQYRGLIVPPDISLKFVEEEFKLKQEVGTSPAPERSVEFHECVFNYADVEE